MPRSDKAGPRPESGPTECVLQLMAEGGSLKVLATASKTPQFAVWLEDQCLVFVNAGPAISTQSHWGTFDQAIALLGRYPWRKLHPRYIAPAYLDRILAEVTRSEATLSQEVLERWDDATMACRTNEQRTPRM